MYCERIKQTSKQANNEAAAGKRHHRRSQRNTYKAWNTTARLCEIWGSRQNATHRRVARRPPIGRMLPAVIHAITVIKIVILLALQVHEKLIVHMHTKHNSVQLTTVSETTTSYEGRKTIHLTLRPMSPDSSSLCNVQNNPTAFTLKMQRFETADAKQRLLVL